MELVRRMLSGDEAALSQLITKVEDDLIDSTTVMREIHSHLGHSYCVGITGPPGVGKSTLIDRLARVIRQKGFSIGIIMVDPTSPVTSGALLGDRIRVQSHNLDDGVFMRSMATRGQIGGLSKKVFATVKILDSYGKDFVLIETVGIGQVETSVVGIANTNILVLAPHAGDVVQAMKCGIMELADIFVINKADLGKADHLFLDLEFVVGQRKSADSWTPPIVEAQARNNDGIDEVYRKIELHREFLQKEGLLLKHRRKRDASQFIELVKEQILSRIMKSLNENGVLRGYSEKVDAGELDPYSACDEMLSNIKIR
jgi:LAO/AO transport system kinase